MSDPHAKAVEAAAMALDPDAFLPSDNETAREIRAAWQSHAIPKAERVITAYLAAMRAEGWVMVRDVGDTQPATVPWRYGDAWDGIQDGVGIGTLDALCNGYADGWNACRAAMLKGAGDGQG